MANNTALRAGKDTTRTITFKNKEHEKFYYTYLPKCRYQDVYHKALVYCLGIDRDTRENAEQIYDFKTGYRYRRVIPRLEVCMKGGRQAAA